MSKFITAGRLIDDMEKDKADGSRSKARCLLRALMPPALHLRFIGWAKEPGYLTTAGKS